MQSAAAAASDQAGMAIQVSGLTRSYPSGAKVGPLTFDVPRGVITGLVGPNGVGKTTTIRMLLGLITPDVGEVRVLDASSWDDLPGVLDRVGALVDGPSLVPTLSGRKNLLMLSRLAGWPDTCVDDALEMVGLTERAQRRVREYSLGMRQRLALAGALLGKPDLLVVDEPANGLDPQGVAELRLLLSRVAGQGTTIVVSSHVLTEVEQVCDHLVVMSDRGVAYHGPRAALAARLKGSLVVEVVEPGDLTRMREVLLAQGFQADAGADAVLRVVEGDGVAPDGGKVNALAIEAGIVLARIEPRRQSLEDVFFELTGAPGSTSERLGAMVADPDAAPFSSSETQTDQEPERRGRFGATRRRKAS